ncbi:MAG: hypothetical protein GEU75_12010 [Dehalococcoidia bacterium]|nr:hypothetical protein [Dehalococcoidia bacterium]
MPPNFEFEFFYPRRPTLSVGVRNKSGPSGVTTALMDTGADITLIDLTVAEQLGLSLLDLPPIRISGVGGSITEARRAEVELRLLNEPDLALTIPVAFAPIRGLGIGNLIGLDVLSHFDFGISHSTLTAYLGRTAT